MHNAHIPVGKNIELILKKSVVNLTGIEQKLYLCAHHCLMV